MDSLAMIVRASMLILLTVVTASTAASDEDLVTDLPGLSALNVSFRIFSGYVTVDENNGSNLFYYFVEARNNSQSKPLTLWLNGGPGCSSVGFGAFFENGPFRIRNNALEINSYSWNQESNMLYLDSPVGVGFSYSDYDLDMEDEKTARDNFIFLQRWLEKFPQYKDRGFYLAGESYAGHYIPQLAHLMVNSNRSIHLNLRGILMGNPVIDYRVDAARTGGAEIFYLWTHGQISDDTYFSIVEECDNFSNSNSHQTSDCKALLNYAISYETYAGVLDTYDVTIDNCPSVDMGMQARLLQNLKLEKVTPSVEEFLVPDLCNSTSMIPFLNRKDVQAALHAKLVDESQPWQFCNQDLKYTISAEKMQPLLQNLLENDVRVWVYSGDQDAVVPLTGTRTVVNKFAKELGWNITSPYQTWSSQNQIAGWTIRYETKLLYATVRGAGHLVPRSRPVQSLQLFSSFLRGINLPLTRSLQRS